MIFEKRTVSQASHCAPLPRHNTESEKTRRRAVWGFVRFFVNDKKCSPPSLKQFSYWQILTKLQTFWFFQNFHSSQYQEKNFLDFAVSAVRVCFGQTVVVISPRRSFFCCCVQQHTIRSWCTLVFLRKVSLGYLRSGSLCKAASRVSFPTRSW